MRVLCRPRKPDWNHLSEFQSMSSRCTHPQTEHTPNPMERAILRTVRQESSEVRGPGCLDLGLCSSYLGKVGLNSPQSLKLLCNTVIVLGIENSQPSPLVHLWLRPTRFIPHQSKLEMSPLHNFLEKKILIPSILFLVHSTEDLDVEKLLSSLHPSLSKE